MCTEINITPHHAVHFSTVEWHITCDHRGQPSDSYVFDVLFVCFFFYWKCSSIHEIGLDFGIKAKIEIMFGQVVKIIENAKIIKNAKILAFFL